MDPATLPLAALRLAPVQCTSWGHPTTSGLPTMDYFLSSDLMEPQDGASHYTETLIRLPKLSIFYTPDHAATGAGGEDRATAMRAALGFPADAVVYWCGQSLHKYLPEHDSIFPRIAARIPGARFLFIDAKPALTNIFRHRLDTAFAAQNLDFAHHCRFLPTLPPAEFAASLRCTDIFLDSISWSGCNTTLEALAFDLPIVTCSGALMRGRHSAAILAVMGMTETVAGSLEEYVDLAIRLGENPTWRREISARLAAGKWQLYSELAPVRALESLLKEWAGAKS
jgi:protein O-GlcNAc transferase